MSGAWEKISKKLSGAFGVTERDEDTADRVLKIQQATGPHELPVDPITEWREDRDFLAGLVAGRQQREQKDHQAAVSTIVAVVGQGTQNPVAAPATARFKRTDAS